MLKWVHLSDFDTSKIWSMEAGFESGDGGFMGLVGK